MQIKDFAPSYGIAIMVALSIWFLKYLPLSNWIILPIQLITGITILITISRATHMPEFEEIKTITTTSIKRLKRNI
jgi:hypothetical protein